MRCHWSKRDVVPEGSGDIRGGARSTSGAQSPSASATLLSIMRWSENYHLFVLGAVAFGCAWFGRSALRRRWREWVRLHISGMSLSYVVMLIAFYVDNGKQLPIWKDLPHFTYWLVPPVVAAPSFGRCCGTQWFFGSSGPNILENGAMCNLYSITTNQAAIIALFRVSNRYVGNLPPMPGVFPDYPAS